MDNSLKEIVNEYMLGAVDDDNTLVRLASIPSIFVCEEEFRRFLEHSLNVRVRKIET